MKFTEETTLQEILDDESIKEVSFAQALNDMDEAKQEKFDKACGDDLPIIVRWAQIMLAATSGDGDVSDDEIKMLKKIIKEEFAELGEKFSKDDLEAFVDTAADSVDEIVNTCKIFKKFLSKEAIKGVIYEMTAAAGKDDLDEDEAEAIRFMGLYLMGVYSDDDLEEFYSGEEE